MFHPLKAPLAGGIMGICLSLVVVLSACSASHSDSSSPAGAGGNLPTVTGDTCNILSVAQASTIVGPVDHIQSVVTSASNSVLCSYIASNGGPAFTMQIYISAGAHDLYTIGQSGYQHLSTLSGYGDTATVGYQDHLPSYALFLLKGHTYVFIQDTNLNLDASLNEVKAVAQAILPKI